MKFNLFEAKVNHDFWEGAYFYHRKLPSDRAGRRSIYEEVARLWRDEAILAATSDTHSDTLWVVAESASINELRDFIFELKTPQEAPAAVLLNLFLLTEEVDLGGQSIFREPTKCYWEVWQNKKGTTRICLLPTFSLWQGGLVASISASYIRQAHEKEVDSVPKEVYRQVADSDYEFRSVGLTTVEAGDFVRRPPKRDFKAQWPWTADSKKKTGVLASKRNFLEAIVESINRSGMAQIAPKKLEVKQAKEVLGARGMKARLYRKNMEAAIASAIPSGCIHLYDRRTDVTDRIDWTKMSIAIDEKAKDLGLKVIDHQSSAYEAADGPILVCIDSADLFNGESSEDTKPQAVAGFPMPVQCFHQEALVQTKASRGEGKKKEREGDEREYEKVIDIDPAALLVMLANQIIKTEAARGRLMMPREWLVGDIGQYLFCAAFQQGGSIIYLGIHIALDGSLDFLEADSFSRMRQHARERSWTPIIKLDHLSALYQPLDGEIQVELTPVRALPLTEKKGMSQHFAGVNIVPSLSSYYAGGADNPAQLTVPRALVLRQVRSVNGGSREDVLALVAGTCVDPTVRVNSATVWPAPYKILNEYFLLRGEEAAP